MVQVELNNMYINIVVNNGSEKDTGNLKLLPMYSFYYFAHTQYFINVDATMMVPSC
jgi:hypothetical protein